MPRIMTDDYCFASFYMSERCNFRCAYCFIFYPVGALKTNLRKMKKLLKPRQGPPRHDLYRELDTVIENFLKTGKRITLGFTGGEPFVYPHFIDICKRIVAHDGFKIALDTNLTGNVKRFVEAVPPGKVEYIYANLHIEERERIYGDIRPFLDDVVLLKNTGYSIDVCYLMYPPLFDRIERDFGFCRERGVEPSIKEFVGVYNGKTYPASYTKQEYELIRKFDPRYTRSEYSPRAFNGRICNAGMSLVRIKSNGDVIRCGTDHSLLGNIYTGFELYDTARPCMMNVCTCFSADRLFDGHEHDPIVRTPMNPVARLRHLRNKFIGFWEQE
jgi:MoaA/NifB/PqqE/SkfB family radical SAM enzyme